MTFPKGYSQRPATPEDAAVIARHRYPDQQDAHERPVYADWVREALGRGTYRGALAEVGGTVVAGAGLSVLDWGPTRGDPQPLRGRLVNVWTHPEHRRQGLARALTAGLLREAGASGLRTLSLSSTPEARPLYESLGFRLTTNEWRLTLEATP